MQTLTTEGEHCAGPYRYRGLTGEQSTKSTRTRRRTLSQATRAAEKEEKKGEQKKKKRASHLLFLPLVPSPGTLHGGAGVRIDARSSSSSMCSLALYRRPYAMVFLFCFLRFFCLDLIEAKQSEAKRARERVDGNEEGPHNFLPRFRNSLAPKPRRERP